MIKAGVLGATGYAGSELVRILSGHPEVSMSALCSQSYQGKAFDEVYDGFRGMELPVLSKGDLESLAEECDVVFLALPHGEAAKLVTADILEKTKIIDFGADFRLKDADVYEAWYGLPHTGRALLPEAVYGLCEINREAIKKARLVANPGCYTTCAILSLYPLVKNNLIKKDSVIIDAKSGVTGAGRGLTVGSLYCEANENMKAYKIASHRHTPEIEEQLSYGAEYPVVLNFTPHLTPMNRGILATCYATLQDGVTEQQIRECYREQYQKEYFVRLTKPGVFPETRFVKSSNFIDIGIHVDGRTGRVIVVGAIDNLGKGAAGQAVQNMNLLFRLPENMGLRMVPVFP